MNLAKVVVVVDGTVVIIDGDNLPIIGHVSNPVIVAAVARVSPTVQVEQHGAVVLVVHAPEPQIWNRIPGNAPEGWMADWTPRGTKWNTCYGEEVVVLSVEKPTD